MPSFSDTEAVCDTNVIFVAFQTAAGVNTTRCLYYTCIKATAFVHFLTSSACFYSGQAYIQNFTVYVRNSNIPQICENQSIGSQEVDLPADEYTYGVTIQKIR